LERLVELPGDAGLEVHGARDQLELGEAVRDRLQLRTDFRGDRGERLGAAGERPGGGGLIDLEFGREDLRPFLGVGDAQSVVARYLPRKSRSWSALPVMASGAASRYSRLLARFVASARTCTPGCCARAK